jgi:hypothetical protein
LLDSGKPLFDKRLHDAQIGMVLGPCADVGHESPLVLNAFGNVDGFAVSVPFDAFEFGFQRVFHEKYTSSCRPGFGVHFKWIQPQKSKVFLNDFATLYLRF